MEGGDSLTEIITLYKAIMASIIRTLELLRKVLTGVSINLKVPNPVVVTIITVNRKEYVDEEDVEEA